MIQLMLTSTKDSRGGGERGVSESLCFLALDDLALALTKAGVGRRRILCRDESGQV